MLWSRGLLGSWSLENSTADGSGNGNNGTRHGTPPPFVAGRIGQCLSFNVAGDYVDVGGSLGTLGEMTRTAWILTNTVAAGDRAILSSYQLAGNLSAGAFFLNHMAKRLGLYWGTSYILNGSTDMTTGTWYHVGAVRAGSSGNWTAKLFLQGRLDGSTTTAVNPTASGPTSIGRTGDYPGEYFDGLIDEVHIWNRALPESDIRRVMMGLHPIS